MEKAYVVGVDIGGQTTKIGIVDRRGTIVTQTVIGSKYKAGEAGVFIQAVCDTIRELAKEVGFENIQGIGIGAPNGNYYKGTIEDAANLEWAKGIVVELAKEVSLALDNLPVTVTNDANAAAVGEMTYGAARGMKNFIMITLGTGVGSGIVVDGKIVYGSDGFAGELGHFVVDHTPAGRKCGCGRSGCLETYCSATGVARTAREFLEKNTCDSLLRSLDPANITSYDVFKAAEQGDKIALEIFDFTGKMLGTACADFTTFNTPEAFVFFGGLTKAGDYLMKPLKEAYDANVLNIFQGNAKLLISSLNGSEAAVLGASALGWE